MFCSGTIALSCGGKDFAASRGLSWAAGYFLDCKFKWRETIRRPFITEETDEATG
jgi:hypothetical protein